MIDLLSETGGRRAPFGWPTLRLDPQSDGVPDWEEQPESSQGGWLRICTSVDDREEKRIEVYARGSGEKLGCFDLRFAHSLQPFQIGLDPVLYGMARRQDVRFRLVRGDSPLWILHGKLPEEAACLQTGLVPRTESPPLSAFFARLRSLASVQPFGWMKGCVLDGLHDLFEFSGARRWLDAVRNHFSLFITPAGELVYEDPAGIPADGKIYGIEGTLPFAVLAKWDPEHPLLDLMAGYYRSRLDPSGNFVHAEQVTAEGSYTIACPLAVLARQRNDAGLARLAAAPSFFTAQKPPPITKTDPAMRFPPPASPAPAACPPGFFSPDSGRPFPNFSHEQIFQNSKAV